MKPRSEMTDAEESAMWMQREVDDLLDELSYVAPLEIAQGLVDNPADLATDHARRLAAVIRDRVRGGGVLKRNPDPPPVKKPVMAGKAKPTAAAAPPRPIERKPDLFS